MWAIEKCYISWTKAGNQGVPPITNQSSFLNSCLVYHSNSHSVRAVGLFMRIYKINIVGLVRFNKYIFSLSCCSPTLMIGWIDNLSQRPSNTLPTIMANMSSHQSQATNYWINQAKQLPNTGLKNAAKAHDMNLALKEASKIPSISIEGTLYIYLAFGGRKAVAVSYPPSIMLPCTFLI